MSRRHVLLALTAGLTVAVLTVAASALAGPPATSSIGVEIQARGLTGLRPDGGTANVDIKAVVQGGDASSLAGEGRIFGAGGAHGYWSPTGSIGGDLVTLSGVLTESNIGWVGTPVVLEANSSTGAITVTMGPITAGPFVGRMLVVEGFGTVKTKTS